MKIKSEIFSTRDDDSIKGQVIYSSPALPDVCSDIPFSQLNVRLPVDVPYFGEDVFLHKQNHSKN